MRIYCLTSIKIIQQRDGIQRCITDEPESFKDEYTIRTMNSNEIKKAEAYALTEIDIGYDFIRYTNYPIATNVEQQIKVYWLSIYRDDTNLIMVPMLPGNVKLDEVEDEKGVYDLFVGLCHIKFSYEKFDIVLRIRCIKNTTIKGMISKDEEERYRNFAEQVEKHSEGRENAFKFLSFTLQHETAASALRTKMSDFKTLIELLCDPESGNVEHVPSGKRYNQRSKCILSDRKYWIHKKQAKPRKETMKNEARQFRDCKKIDLNSVKLADLDLQTLESDNLERLWLTDIDLTEDIKTLKLYAKNINFTKLKDIDLNSCKTQLLPKDIAEKLPISLENIILQNCNIASIPQEISYLINLEQLHLEENEGLLENGIPWDFLPPNLTSLSLEDNSIVEVPAAICRLTKLKVLNIVSETLKSVAWKEISDTIEWLKIESKAELNPMELFGKNSITHLIISCPFLTDIKSFPSTTHLYFDNCGLQYFNCQNSLQTLVELSIVENGLKGIAWEYLPVSLEVLNLDKNHLQKIENIGHLINLQELRLNDNDINYISTDITQLTNLKLLYLCDNYLTELPTRFENLQHLSDLRLSGNDFTYHHDLPDDLNDKLWKRLPLSLGQLVLNSNNLFKIPCCFRFIKLINLHIKGCNLHHICPRVYLQAQRLKTFSKTYCLSIDIRKNEDLKHLSFIPAIIYQPPLAVQEKLKLDVINTFWMTSMELATDNQKLRNTSKFPMHNFKPKYDFKISEIQNFCDCCAGCGKTAATKSEPLQKQNMVMDFMLIFADENESDPFEKPKLEPGKWKSEIHTKMCDSCRKGFFEKTEIAYQKSQHENDEMIEKRQKLPVNNPAFVLGLQPVPIQEMAAQTEEVFLSNYSHNEQIEGSNVTANLIPQNTFPPISTFVNQPLQYQQAKSVEPQYFLPHQIQSQQIQSPQFQPQQFQQEQFRQMQTFHTAPVHEIIEQQQHQQQHQQQQQQQLQYQTDKQQSVDPQYFLPQNIQPQQFQPMQAFTNFGTNEHRVISNPNDHSYQSITHQPNTNHFDHISHQYQTPQHFQQQQPLSPFSSFVNNSYNQDCAPLNENPSANPNYFNEQQIEAEYMYYYPADDDEWSWKKNL